MDHSYFKDRVSAYYDQDLPLQELELMRRHVAECVECQAMLAEFGRLDQLVNQKSDLSESADYWEESAKKIEARLDEKKQRTVVTDIKRSGWSGIWWKAGSVAAAVLVVGFVALHRFDILDEDIDPFYNAQPAVPTEVEKLEQKNAEARRPDTPVQTTNEPAQPVESDRIRADERVLQPENKPQADAAGESPVIQKLKRREVQPLSAEAPTVQAPAAQSSEQKSTTGGMSAEAVEDGTQLKKNIVAPEKPKTMPAPKKSAESTVKVRGGRAGETEYVVDSVKDEELAEKVDSDATKKNVKGLATEAVKSKGDINLSAMSNSLAPRQKDSINNELRVDTTANTWLRDTGPAPDYPNLQKAFSGKSDDLNYWRQFLSDSEWKINGKAKIEYTPFGRILRHREEPGRTWPLDDESGYSFDFLAIEVLWAKYNICRFTDSLAEYDQSYKYINRSTYKDSTMFDSTIEPAVLFLRTLDSLNRFAK